MKKDKEKEISLLEYHNYIDKRIEKINKNIDKIEKHINKILEHL